MLYCTRSIVVSLSIDTQSEVPLATDLPPSCVKFSPGDGILYVHKANIEHLVRSYNERI